MPILPPEPFAFPANLFAESEMDTGGEWYVMHTKSRAEKSLARWLLASSVRFFLPLYRSRGVRNGRPTTAYRPLFSGYVFVRGDADARYRALASKQVAQCLTVPDQERLATDLAAVYRLMAGESPLTPAPQIPPGSPVEVIEGPFAGMTGRLIRVGARARLLVEVEMINQGVSVELDCAAVRPLTANGSAERARLALLRG